MRYILHFITAIWFIHPAVGQKHDDRKMINTSYSITPEPPATAYFLSGLGADRRVFDKLKLDPKIPVVHFEWIKPFRKETLHDYAKRLIVQIDTTKPFQLVGLSFGGIIAAELADIANPRRVVIISSTATGIPVSSFYQGLLKVLLASPLAVPVLKSPNFLVNKYFGADTSELKALLKNILHDTNGRFLKWALVRMSRWSRPEKVPGLYHIHGTADRLIPIQLVKPDVYIERGGHLMVYAQHEEISEILNKQLLQ
jgi:pimeloyl-ACP methyl ester carboxylesterase